MTDIGRPSTSAGTSDPYRGVKLLHDPVRNKGTAFTEAEREARGLRGLLPPGVLTQEVQVQRVLKDLERKGTDLERYMALSALQDRNEVLFYRVLVDHLEAMMPLVYTPTVGEACQEYGAIFRRPRGLFISADDKGNIAELLAHWSHQDVRIIVVTDGERILGLGDLGAYGMGIPVGKLSLYTACAGIHPTHCLPVTIDVGTNNQELLNDPFYIGLRQPRVGGQAYDDLVEEFYEAVEQLFPGAVIQLEDFATRHAFELLERYRDRACTFDDDIQGTAAVAVAGICSSLRITGGKLTDGRFLFLGAGEAGIGIGHLLVAALKAEGMSEAEATERCWFMDSKGLCVQSRTDLPPHKVRFALDHEPLTGLVNAINACKPTALIGVSGVPGSFDQAAVTRMGELNERPIVFALSNPTSKSECTAAQAYEWTDGRAIFASGSPFDPVEYEGRVFVPGQGNNAYIFPGVGLGAIVSQTRHVTDEMFFAAARVLADLVTEDDLDKGRVYPPLTRVREVSAAIATEVARIAWQSGLARAEQPDDIEALVKTSMFDPVYSQYVD